MDMNRSALILIPAVFALSAVSCKKDEASAPTDPLQSIKDKLVGNWDLVEISEVDCDNLADNEVQTFGCDTIDGVEVCLEGFVQFSADGTFDSNYTVTEDGSLVLSEDVAGTWTLDNADQMNLCLSGDECTTQTYSLTDNSLTMLSTDPDFGCTSTITASR